MAQCETPQHQLQTLMLLYIPTSIGSGTYRCSTSDDRYSIAYMGCCLPDVTLLVAPRSKAATNTAPDAAIPFIAGDQPLTEASDKP